MTHQDPSRALEHVQSLPSWLAGRVAARGRGLVADALVGEGLRLPHHAVLAAVAEHGPVAQADVVRSLEIDPKDVVLLLNELEKRGLLVRERDAGDRRKNAVRVTSDGREVLARCMALAEQANAELLAPLSAGERAQLIALLARVHQA